MKRPRDYTAMVRPIIASEAARCGVCGHSSEAHSDKMHCAICGSGSERRRCIGVPAAFGPSRTCGRRIPRRNRWRCGPCNREIERRQIELAARLKGQEAQR